jgi:hypothetical protein
VAQPWLQRFAGAVLVEAGKTLYAPSGARARAGAILTRPSIARPSWSGTRRSWTEARDE